MARARAEYELAAVDKTQQAFDSVRKRFKDTTQSFASFRNAIVGIAGAGGIGLMIKRSIEAADRVNDLSKRLGTTTEFMSRMGFAAEQSGTSMESVANSLKFMQKNAADGSDAFAKLGIDTEAFLQLNAEQQFLQITQALTGVGTASERTELAMALMGRSGTEMLNIMDGGVESVRALWQEADRLGITLDGLAAEKLAKADDAMKRIEATTGAFARRLSEVLAPAITWTFDQLTFGLEKTIPLMERISGMDMGHTGLELAEAYERFNALTVKLDAASKSPINLHLGFGKSLQEEADQAWEEILALEARMKGFQAALRNPVLPKGLQGGTGVDSPLSPESLSFQVKGMEQAKVAAMSLGDAYDNVFSILRAAETPQETHWRLQNDITNAYLDGVISADQFARAMAETDAVLAEATASMQAMATAGPESMAALSESVEINKEQFEDLRRTIEGWSREFADSLLEGELNFGNFVSSILKQLARIALSKAMDPLFKLFGDLVGAGLAGMFGGGGGNLLGTSGMTAATAQTGGTTQFFATPFGGARAAGGPVSAGRAYLVGERGPELFMPGRSGSIAANAGGVTVPVNIDARGATAEAAAVFFQMAPHFERRIMSQVTQLVGRGVRP